MELRSLRYSDGTSDKFWEIQRSGASHTVRYGRYGTAGQSQMKVFDSDDAARQSFEKLVAEKLKKGYVEDGGAIGPAQIITAPAKSDKPKAAKAPAKSVDSVIVESSEPAQLSYPPVRSLNLNPEDWFWATWRDREPLVKPDIQPFDINDAVNRLSKVPTSNYGWGWDWSKAQMPLVMSREEANFWLTAMTKTNKEISPQELAEELVSQEFTGNIELKDVYKSLFERVDNVAHHTVLVIRHLKPEIILPLIGLFSTEQLFDLLLLIEEERASLQNHDDWGIAQFQRYLVQGFQRYILPYLNRSEIEVIHTQMEAKLDLSVWPSDYYQRPSPIFYLEAYLGCSGLKALVESWPEAYYNQSGWRHDFYHRPQEVIFGLGDRELVQVQMRRLKLSLKYPDQDASSEQYLRAWLAHTEFSALDHIGTAIISVENKKEAESIAQEFSTCVKAPEAAPVMLEIMLSSKAPKVARQWLDDYPDHAIAGLIPTAAGKGKLAEAAIDFLRSMKRKGHTAYIQTCIDHESAEIAAKIRSTILDVEEKTYIPFDAKTTPEWLQQSIEQSSPKPIKKPSWNITPLDLPPIVIGTDRLNDAQVEAVLNTLRQSKLDSPLPLLTSLKTHADRAALDAFSWKLFEAWLAEGAPLKENWAMTSIGLLGTDTSALKLAPMIRVWPGESQHQRAVLGLECLRTIGTDTALMQINGIAQKVKFKGIKQRAQECMEAIAQERGMTKAELEDRIVPDCDLDENGTRIFDFGDRQFRFVLGADLKPMIKDADNKIKSDLPKSNSKDDPAKAEQAIADWKLFKKQLSEIVKLQPDRLEQAMITGRRWPLNDFITLLVQHPLMTHLVQRLIWGGYDATGQLVETFRVTEDRSFADRHDATFTPTGIVQIGIVHPLHLSTDLLSIWGELLSDYDIIPAFPQLGRMTYSLELEEATKKDITRFESVKIPAVSLVGTLDKLGWVRGIPQDAGVFYEHSKPFYGANTTAIVQYQGVPIGYMDEWEDQSIECCFFLNGIYSPEMYPDHNKAINLGGIDPVAISEVLKDLNTIATPKSQ
jgi:predicted DNA-binding WGR domain protein